MLGVSLHPFVSCIISLQSWQQTSFGLYKFKHAPVIQLRQCHRKQSSFSVPKRSRWKTLRNSVTDTNRGHLAPWKSKKMEDVFLWFWPYLQGQCQFLRRLYSKNTCASFSGSLLQIFQIFQLPLRTTKLVNG